jgi:hypothetical protein
LLYGFAEQICEGVRSDFVEIDVVLQTEACLLDEEVIKFVVGDDGYPSIRCLSALRCFCDGCGFSSFEAVHNVGSLHEEVAFLGKAFRTLRSQLQADLKDFISIVIVVLACEADYVVS